MSEQSRGRVWMAGAALAALAAAPLMGAEATRGVGVYPGDPGQDFAPTLVVDSSTYRNVALRRPAYQSSAYDYNLTAQLVTDGIVETVPPRWNVVTLSTNGVQQKHEREFLLDHASTSGIDFDTAPAWAQFELNGGGGPPAVDRVEVAAHPRRRMPWEKLIAPAPAAGTRWTWAVSGSDDGRRWVELGRASGPVPPPQAKATEANEGDFYTWIHKYNPTVKPVVSFAQAVRKRFYRVTLQATGGEKWTLEQVSFSEGGKAVEVGGPFRFSSAWMAAGTGEEWVSVDLGAPCTFDRVALHWIQRPAKGVVQASDEGKAWRDLQVVPAGTGPSDDLKLDAPATARWVRVLMKSAVPGKRYALSELEVFGRGGLMALPKAMPAPGLDGRLQLAGGAWKLQRAPQVSADGATLARVGFDDAAWLVATVPATILSSYWNAGALPDPNVADNHLAVSDSFFHADFWYRTEFEAPLARPGDRVFLNFDGVNWKAEVFLNGQPLGRVEGAFTRGRFDVTTLVRPGEKNALAVRVETNRNPGSAKQKVLDTAGMNGGALGGDNPTYHASIGWDWIPTVRGRNTGLWNDVYLTQTGAVTIENPGLRTTLPLPDVSRADVRIELTLRNHAQEAVSGTLRGKLGDVSFQQPVQLAAGSTRDVVLDPSTVPALRIANPRLWWPNGYGDPNLYDVTLEFAAGGGVSDGTTFKAGLRQFTYSEEGGALRIWVNGRRFVARGGNWGFPETNLRYRGREYDAAVRYHRDMNFTMIRDWVGQVADDEFYEACDRYGIVVWQDFWLANPWDGPDPDDEDLFLRNARDTVARIRNHPSIGLYVGRNEGYPPPGLEKGLREILGALQPDIHYTPNSAHGPVSGEGPYWAEAPKFYFEKRATEKLHSEMGMPNIVNFESLRQMMGGTPPWPPDLTWGLHDFNLKSAQRIGSFREMIDKGYGGASSAEEFTRLAQFVNYDGYRAMFEAQGRNRMGLLLWMSHPCWPSFVWQTYDYYLDPTAGYFGSKKGSEPLHVQWNPTNDTVEVVNYSAGNATGLAVQAEVLDLAGAVKWTKTATLDSAEDSVSAPVTIEWPEGLTPTHFVRLKLTRGDRLVSENFYWRGTVAGDFRALRTLPKVEIAQSTRVELKDGRYVLTTDLRNEFAAPALMVHLQAVRAQSGDRILPALFSDNYVALMPGESCTIRTELSAADARGQQPKIVVDGFNVGSSEEAMIVAPSKH